MGNPLHKQQGRSSDHRPSMLLRDFKAAHIQAPRGRSHDPSWLDGSASGKACFILGGAQGLADSPGVAAAKGQVVIGTNWTLRLLEPSIWLVVDANVWKSEFPRLAGCSDSLVTVVNRGIFGGGVYSTAHANKLKMVGQSTVKPTEIRIRQFRGIERKGGKFGVKPFPYYTPKSASDEFHPGGNSLCFAIQLAHVMGCNPIICSGFTLQSGSSYFHGPTNPATRRQSLYRSDLALAWLTRYESEHPGRARLDPAFAGPVYQVLQRASVDEILKLSKPWVADSGGYEPDTGDQASRKA